MKKTKSNRKAPEESRLLTARLLKRWPLPQPEEDADKKERGTVLVIGGSAAVPGGVLLASTATLRAGAGRLRIALGRSLAVPVALAIPEARVFPLPETESGEIHPSAAEQIGEVAEHCWS